MNALSGIIGNMLKNIASMINWRPISTIGVLGGLHSLWVGLGYILMLPEFTRSLLFLEVGTLMNPTLFFSLMALAGILSVWAFIADKEKWILRANSFQAFMWLFVAMIYFFGGFFLLGLTSGLCWAFIPGYASYVYKDRLNIAAHNAGW